jgi:hypothetical protein
MDIIVWPYIAYLYITTRKKMSTDHLSFCVITSGDKVQIKFKNHLSMHELALELNVNYIVTLL